MPLFHFYRWLLLAAGALMLSACGGGDAPAPPAASVSTPAFTTLTHSMAPADGAELPAGAPVVVRFSAAMDPGSLTLDSDFARQATASWSSATQTNDTLTLDPPPSGWLGQGPLRLSVSSAQGQALTAEASYDVTVPLQTFQPASAVIGQPDFLSGNHNQTQPSARTLSSPNGKPAIDPQGALWLADTDHHRVLRYAMPPSSANAAADLVLGQADFASGAAGLGRTGMKLPAQVAVQGHWLAVADEANSRVLLWLSLPTASGTPPDVVLGQPDFDTGTAGCNAGALNYPTSVAFTPDGRLLVADTDNNRVLIWNQLPTANGAPADVVLGQSGFDRCAFNDDDQDGTYDSQASARTLGGPSDVWTDGQRLVVSDSSNHRVLIWHRFPTTPFQPADLVLGQADFAHDEGNDDDQDRVRDATPSARTLNNPRSVHSNGVQLAVADYDNNRVLIWSRFPTSSFSPADRVLGQSSFTLNAYNDDNQDGTQDSYSARTLSGPTGVLLHGRYLLVSMDNHGGDRVLLFEAP